MTWGDLEKTFYYKDATGDLIMRFAYSDMLADHSRVIIHLD